MISILSSKGLDIWRHIDKPLLHVSFALKRVAIQAMYQVCTDLSLHFALEFSPAHTFVAMKGFEAASKVSRNLQQILHPRGRCFYVGEWWGVWEWYVGMMQRVKMAWRMKYISCHLFVQDWFPDICGRVAKPPSAWYIPLLCSPVTSSRLLVWGVSIVAVIKIWEHMTDIEWCVVLDWPQRFVGLVLKNIFIFKESVRSTCWTIIEIYNFMRSVHQHWWNRTNGTHLWHCILLALPTPKHLIVAARVSTSREDFLMLTQRLFMVS